MNPAEREAMVGLYESRWERLGRDVRTLGWNDEESQRLRFSLLCDGLDLTGRRVLDVGCGFGDLAPWIDRRWSDVSYTGVDLAPSLLAEARRAQPNLRFECVDLLRDDLSERWDVVLCLGALSYRVDDAEVHTASMLRAMWDLADEAVAANFLTSYVNFERAHNVHHRPEDIFAVARGLTPWVNLRHDYPLWEFTVQLRREARTP